MLECFCVGRLSTIEPKSVIVKLRYSLSDLYEVLLFAFGFIAGMVVATLSVIFALAMAGAASRGDELLEEWLRGEEDEW